MPSPRDRSTIFLDLSGVLMDNGPSLVEAYGRAAGELLASRLGGAAADWHGACRDWLEVAPAPPPELPPAEAFRWQDVEAIRGICARLLHEPPPEPEAASLGREVDRRARLHHARFLPGAAEAVRALAATRTLHMASGNARWMVEGTLERLGVRAHIGLPCGADLLGVMKRDERFYEALFALARVEADSAIVVDDTPRYLARAAQRGAYTVLIAVESDAPMSGVDAVLPSLAELAEALR